MVWEAMQLKSIEALPIDQKTYWQRVNKYKIPSHEFNNYEDVFRECGYDYESRTEIGSGGHSEVFKITRISDKTFVAMKCINFRGIDGQVEEREMTFIITEVAIMSQISHKNVVSLVDKFAINMYCYLFMEFANGGTVDSELNDTKDGFPEEKAKKYFKQMVRAIEYLHSRGVTHRDIKPQNVLIFVTKTNEKILKLTDFGLSRVLHNTINTRDREAFGTLQFMSPQVIKVEIFVNNSSPKVRKRLEKTGKVKDLNPIKADIWSLGVSLHYMIGKRFPYDIKKDDDHKKLLKIVDLMMDRKYKSLRDISQDLLDLIDATLEPSSKNRIDISGILRHKWLEGVPDVMTAND